jgi:hypothetical protein
MPVCELTFPLSTHGFLVSMLRNLGVTASSVYHELFP